MTSRRAFLAAIAGAVVAPHARVSVAPERLPFDQQFLLVTDEWLNTVLPECWRGGRLSSWRLLHGYTYDLGNHSTRIPKPDIFELANRFVVRLWEQVQRDGFATYPV